MGEADSPTQITKLVDDVEAQPSPALATNKRTTRLSSQVKLPIQSDEFDEFDELLALFHENASTAFALEDSLIRKTSSLIPSTSAVNLSKILQAKDTPSHATSGRNTPPIDVLERIAEEDEDKILMEAQNNLFTWNFKQGSYYGAVYDEGDYDLDYCGEEAYQSIQGFFDKLPTYKLWWTANVQGNTEGIKEEMTCDPDPLYIQSLSTDPLVRFFGTLLNKGLVDTFRHVLQVVRANQADYVCRFECGTLTEEDVFLKKEPHLLIELADSFSQIEALHRNGLHEQAFNKCVETSKESKLEYSTYLPVIIDVLTVYLYTLSKYCSLDQGQCQAVASCFLADFWKKKGHELFAFKLYADAFSLAQSRAWLLPDKEEGKVSDYAACNLIYYYLRWGKAQNDSTVAEGFFSKAKKIAEHLKRTDLIGAAVAYFIEANALLNRIGLEGFRAELLELKSKMEEEGSWTEESFQLSSWAQALLDLRSKKNPTEAAEKIKSYIEYLQNGEDCYQLHKAYRELALVYESMDRIHIALESFKAAWQSKRVCPVLPDVEDVSSKVTDISTVLPSYSYDNVDFVPYTKQVYAGISAPDRRKRALDICRLYLEMREPEETTEEDSRPTKPSADHEIRSNNNS